MPLSQVLFTIAPIIVVIVAISYPIIQDIRTKSKLAKDRKLEQEFTNLRAAVHGFPSKLELPKKKPNPVGTDGLPLFPCGSIWENGNKRQWRPGNCQQVATHFWISSCNSPTIYCRCDHCNFGNIMNGQDGTKEEATNLVVVQQLMLEDEIE